MEDLLLKRGTKQLQESCNRMVGWKPGMGAADLLIIDRFSWPFGARRLRVSPRSLRDPKRRLAFKENQMETTGFGASPI